MMINLVDNTPTFFPLTQETEGLRMIANQQIGSLIDQHPDLLVFPQCLDDCADDLKDQMIFSEYDSYNQSGERQMNIAPTNMVGFIGVQDTSVSICSRFSPKEGLGKDYFLHYLLQKALSVNLFNLESNYSEDDQIFDFLLLLFPGMLKQALNQGIYKEYQTFSRNDSNVKGTIDVARHLRTNSPFNGNVSYRSREISYDNNITELIRHTIEYINSSQFGKSILRSDAETTECIAQIVSATPSYIKGNRSHIIQVNKKSASHPYYTKYKPLQKLCLRILRHQKIKYGEDSQKIYGILFDMSWLWEEYMSKILPEFTHPQNRKKKGAIYLGTHKAMERYPDLYKGEANGVVLDAKYKRNVDRNDEHQVITYMYRLQSVYGGFLMPQSDSYGSICTDLLGYGFQLGHHYFLVPQEANCYSDFVKKIEANEKTFYSEIQKVCPQQN